MSKNSRPMRRANNGIKATAVAATVAAVFPTLGTPEAAAYPLSGVVNTYEVAVCATSTTKCLLTYASSTAAKEDALTRPGRLPAEDGWPMDGSRDNAFMHASWNARAAVTTKDRGWVFLMTLAHEQPVTSSNPPGPDLANRNERMDICNNQYGANKPSNWDLVTNDQMSSVNSLWNESRAMSEDANQPNAMMSYDTCSGVRLYFIRKNNGAFFG
ncbi:MAG: hypothetical protein M9952_10095 [Microthrixaceae bacterium]|nr:hypothetical protein [Microthrixaceae bacterium]MCO5313266.1 hypothetical protein [Microthrixaceae bacterium]